MPDTVFVAISIDVEEEGLFSGRYATRDVAVANLKRLRSLEPFIARGARPTLFCAYSVFAAEAFDELVAPLDAKGEIGAHLHHWNTPPLAPEAEARAFLPRVPANAVPAWLMQAKLAHLLAAAKARLGKDIIAFRMGRWDLHPQHLPMLAQLGIKVDASMRPLHNLAPIGPDHFQAPPDPFRISAPYGEILEVPLTVAPLFSVLRHLPPPLQRGLRHWGALPILPVEHPGMLMRLATRLHLSRGGRVISLAWHSSEMLPGGNPKLPDEAAVNAFLRKISRYLDWLEASYDIVYVSMGELEQAGPWPQPAPAILAQWEQNHAA